MPPPCPDIIADGSYAIWSITHWPEDVIAAQRTQWLDDILAAYTVDQRVNAVSVPTGGDEGLSLSELYDSEEFPDPD